MRCLIAIAAILIAVVGMGRAPVTTTDGQIFRYWFYSTIEPANLQSLGFANWQMLYDDIVSENGVIGEVALRFESPTASNGQTLSFKVHPIRGRHRPIWNANTLNARDRIVHSQPVGTTSPWSV